MLSWIRTNTTLLTKDRFYSGADPKTTAWQLLDVERCKYKSLIVICFYSVLDPKLTALLIKRLLDLDRCKHRCLVEICFYSDTDPNLLLDQERLNVCQICSKSSKWDNFGGKNGKMVLDRLKIIHSKLWKVCLRILMWIYSHMRGLLCKFLPVWFYYRNYKKRSYKTRHWILGKI